MSTLTAAPRLARHVLRRDRLRVPIWLVALGVLFITSAASLPPLYETQDAIRVYTAVFEDNPALIAFAGPGYGFDDPNLGVILVNELQLWGCIALGLMSIFLVNRHTRLEEDEERIDLLRSGVVGRHAPTTAAVAVVTGINVVVALIAAVGFVALGYPTAGSLALAGSFLAVGLVFVGVTAVVAQVVSSSRATLALSSALLGAAFLLRALGDVSDSWLRWLSPIGLAQGVRAFADERWWMLAICFALAAGLVVAAFWLSTKRDLGSGLLPTRPGPATASGALTRRFGLALRLQRAALVGWVVGLAVIGAVYGSVGESIEEMVHDNDVYADFMAQIEGAAAITDSFFATTLMLQALLASGFAISSVLRLRGEETAGRGELLLAGPQSRLGWAAGHVGIAVVGTVVVVAAGGLGLGAAYAVVVDDPGEIPRLVAASLVTVPAVLVMAGVALALFGLVPRAAMAAWGALAVVVAIGLFGQLLRLPDWLVDLSPFEHLPGVPARPFDPVPIAALLLTAVALGAVGLWSLRRRDLATS